MEVADHNCDQLWENQQLVKKIENWDFSLKQERILCWARWYLILNIQLLTGEDTAHASRCFDIPSNDIMSFNAAIENWSRLLLQLSIFAGKLVVRSNSANAWRASKYMSIGKDDLWRKSLNNSNN